MDIFIEYIVKRQRGMKENVITAAIILSVPTLIFLALMMMTTALAPFAFLAAVGVLVLAYFLIVRMNVEFEYIITNDEMDIDKITAKKTRKRIITIDLKKVDLISSVNNRDFKSELESPRTNIIWANSNSAGNTYFINFTKDGQTYRVFIDANEKMLEAMKVAAPRKVHTLRKRALT